MDIITAALIAWIVAKTGLAAPGPPHVKFIPDHLMTQSFRAATQKIGESGSICSPSWPGAKEMHKKSKILAFFVCSSSTIYLPNTWRAEKLRDRGILLHELVHHVQRFNNQRPTCPGMLERQAYELQADWLREQGVEDPYELTGLDLFTMLMLTACLPPDS